MLGDQQDMEARLMAVLPSRWFPDEVPVLGAVLQGLASAWAWAFSTLQYVKTQTRIASATGVWLDVIAQDFFGPRLTRAIGQQDDAFRSRIQLALFRERGTRGALFAALEDLTGRTPVIFEPRRTGDTGGYGSARGGGSGLAYGLAGGWGSLMLPFQCFVTAYRPAGTGIAFVNGWAGGAGGYGIGVIEYADLTMVQG
ncbi:MAG: hypothetical protein ACREF3_01015, partial [Acetobacteraceae bacterium]